VYGCWLVVAEFDGGSIELKDVQPEFTACHCQADCTARDDGALGLSVTWVACCDPGDHVTEFQLGEYPVGSNVVVQCGLWYPHIYFVVGTFDIPQIFICGCTHLDSGFVKLAVKGSDKQCSVSIGVEDEDTDPFDA
jgi:hypothetical protein